MEIPGKWSTDKALQWVLKACNVTKLVRNIVGPNHTNHVLFFQRVKTFYVNFS